MSADNWTQCPRCEENIEREWNERILRHAATYGNVDPETFMAEAAEIVKGMPKMGSNFREDYEFYMLAEDGVVKVVASYSGYCSACDLELNFKDSHPLFTLTKGEQCP